MRDAAAFARGLWIWLVPFAIVGVVLGLETDWGRSVGYVAPAPAAAPAPPVAVALLPEYRIEGGIEARKETVDRVLFNPTRRPAPPATQSAASPSAMKRGLYTLTGTTVVGNVATAVLREVNGGKARSVRKGETLNGMLIAEVTPDRVRLKQGDEFEDLPLKLASGPRTTVQPAVATAAPAAPTGQPAGAPPGGSGVGAAAASPGAAGPGARSTARPVAPPPAAPPATPAPRAGGTTSVSELLAERRRAARAAAEAAAGGTTAPQR